MIDGSPRSLTEKGMHHFLEMDFRGIVFMTYTAKIYNTSGVKDSQRNNVECKFNQTTMAVGHGSVDFRYQIPLRPNKQLVMAVVAIGE